MSTPCDADSPTPRRFDAILYDFGGVFTGSPFAAIAQNAEPLGISGAELEQLVFGPYHDDTDHPWHRLERGELSFQDARAAIIDLARAAGHDFDPFSALRSSVADDRDHSSAMVAHLRELRTEGYRSAIVTNNIREFREHWVKMIPVDELFDDIIDSAFEGLRKPDIRIYELALRRVGAVASRTVFLDDFEPNVVAARSLGMVGIVVTDDRLAAIAELDAVLGR